jgi:PHS family inorganic phosphate transporter-like MFS transporter
MDKTWRIVSSVGALPAVIAIIFRFTITDLGRYTLDVQDDGDRAIYDTESHYGTSPSSSTIESIQLGDIQGESTEADQHQEPPERQESQKEDEMLPDQFTYRAIREYFYDQGNWRYLAGTSLCWFLMDFAFFGLGLNNPKTLANIWGEPLIGPLYPLLLQDARRSLLTVSIGSVLGIFVLIIFIDRIRRRLVLIYSFLGLGILFIFTGVTYICTRNHRTHIITIVLSSLCQFVFNLGM